MSNPSINSIKFYCLDLNGNLKFSVPVDNKNGFVTSNATLGKDNNFYFATKYALVSMKTDGGINWAKEGLSSHLKNPVIYEDYLFVSSEMGLYIFDLNGNQLQFFELQMDFYTPLITENYIYAGSRNGKLIIYKW